jgi:HEAT repeat protein
MKLLQSPLFWLVMVTLGAMAVLVALKLARRNKPASDDLVTNSRPLAGFKDAVKNPDAWQQNLNERQQIMERGIEAAQTWNDREIADAVRRFVFDATSSQEAWADFKVLQSLGTRTHAPLLSILSDDTLRAQLLKPTGKDLLPEAPFNRICKLFDETPLEQSVPLLEPFLDDKSEEIRKDAAMTLGSVGSARVVGPVRKALVDEDEYVRSYALIGLMRTIRHKRLSDECRHELFGNVRRLLAEGENCDNAARVLLDFDEKQATKFFLSDVIFTPDAKALHSVLQALRERQLVVPRDRILNLVEQFAMQELKYPHDYQLGEALRALGKHQVPEDRPILERYLSSRERAVAKGAAEGMVVSQGLQGFRERMWKLLEDHGFNALTIPQRQYFAVMDFDGEVNNGGLTQYFFNSSGDSWRAAQAGLEAMGSTERLAILCEAVTKFGAAGPSENRAERMRQLSKIERADENAFDKLDSRYYKCTEVISVMAMRYVLKNPDAFR